MCPIIRYLIFIQTLSSIVYYGTSINYKSHSSRLDLINIDIEEKQLKDLFSNCTSDNSVICILSKPRSKKILSMEWLEKEVNTNIIFSMNSNIHSFSSFDDYHKFFILNLSDALESTYRTKISSNKSLILQSIYNEIFAKLMKNLNLQIFYSDHYRPLLDFIESMVMYSMTDLSIPKIKTQSILIADGKHSHTMITIFWWWESHINRMLFVHSNPIFNNKDIRIVSVSLNYQQVNGKESFDERYNTRNAIE